MHGTQSGAPGSLRPEGGRGASDERADRSGRLQPLFPATGGALYGRANHSPFASFQRPDNRTKIPGLYLAGGSVHPGPGVPMAALSGRLAAARIVVRPRFNTPVAPDGYRWWYVDGLSDDGRHGLSVIAFVGSVFSPYYAWSGRKDPYDHIASMSRSMAQSPLGDDRARQSTLDNGPDHFSVGPSALHWEGNTLVIDVNEVTVPWPSRLKGQIRFTPDVSQPTPFALDTSERHHWWPYAPFGHIEARFANPTCPGQGHGYADTNTGPPPLKRIFRLDMVASQCRRWRHHLL
jgi:hypothetical protein